MKKGDSGGGVAVVSGAPASAGIHDDDYTDHPLDYSDTGYLNPSSSQSVRGTLGSCNDIAFVLLYFAACAGLAAMAMVHAKKPMLNSDFEFESMDPSRSQQGAEVYVYIILGAIPFAGVSAYLALLAMERDPVRFVYASLVSFNIFLWSLAGGALVGGQVGGAIIFSIMALIHLGWFFIVRKMIPFTASLLHWTSTAVRRFPSLFGVAVFSTAVQFCAFLAIVYAAVTTVRTFPKDDEASQYAVLVFSIFVAFWTFGVIQNVLHVTTSGAVGTWYYQGEATPAGTPGRSFRRAITTSFGSICFGSLLVAIVQTLRYIAQYMRRHARDNGGALLAFCCECFIGLLESLLRWFNSYAFVIVALRGLPYFRAASAAYDLVSQQGISMLINDDMTNYVVFMTSMTSGAIAGLTAAVIALAYGKPAMVIAFVVGTIVFLLMTILFNVVVSGMKTFYVCYAEDPAVLHDRHMELGNMIQQRRQDNYESGAADDVGGSNAI